MMNSIEFRVYKTHHTHTWKWITYCIMKTILKSI